MYEIGYALAPPSSKEQERKSKTQEENICAQRDSNQRPARLES